MEILFICTQQPAFSTDYAFVEIRRWKNMHGLVRIRLSKRWPSFTELRKLNWGKSFLRKKMYWGFSYLNGVSKKTVQKRRTCPCWRRKNPKIQLIAESEGAIALFCQKELSLYEIKELLISIHLLRWLETVFCILRLWTRCDFSDWNCTVLNEVTLFSTFHCA